MELISFTSRPNFNNLIEINIYFARETLVKKKKENQTQPDKATGQIHNQTNKSAKHTKNIARHNKGTYSISDNHRHH